MDTDCCASPFLTLSVPAPSCPFPVVGTGTAWHDGQDKSVVIMEMSKEKSLRVSERTSAEVQKDAAGHACPELRQLTRAICLVRYI